MLTVINRLFVGVNTDDMI